MPYKIVTRELAKRRMPCVYENCDGVASIHKYRTTRFGDLGNGPGGDRSFLDVKYGVYHCPKCDRHFTQELPEGAYGRGHSHFTKRVHDKAIGLVMNKKKTLVESIRQMKHQYGTDIPTATLSDWVRREKDRKEEEHGTTK